MRNRFTINSRKMVWEGIIGQRRVTDLLSHALESERVAQAYLFYGPEGSGKQAVAITLAAALQISPNDARKGEHTAFSRALRLLHPDVHVFFPTPKEIDEAEIAARLALLREDQYRHVDTVRLPEPQTGGKKGGKQAFYSVERMNEHIKPRVKYRPNEGRYQVVILLEADYLRVEAANAFLKVLEEPGQQTIFILTSSRPEKLLPTIVSRCQQIRFDPLEVSEMADALQKRLGLDARQALLFARMAEGSINKALELATNPDILQHRALIVSYFRAVYSRNVLQLAELHEQLVKMGRDGLKSVIRLMLLWVRDIALILHTQDLSRIVNADYEDVLAKLVQALPNAKTDQMVQSLEEAYFLVERNINESLILMALSDALARAMRGLPCPSLIRTLTDI